MKFSNKLLLLFLFLSSQLYYGQNPKIYSLESMESNQGENFGFISLTDGYAWNANADSVVIDEKYLGSEQFNPENHHVLSDRNRKIFLENLGLKESDFVFIHSFQIDSTFQFSLSELQITSFLSPYSSYTPYSLFDYYVGIELDESQIKINSDLYIESEALVYVGEVNPFAESQLKHLKWEKLLHTEYPSDSLDLIHELMGVEYETAYFFHTEEYDYFTRFYYIPQKLYARNIRVVSNQTNQIKYNYSFVESEGTFLNPIHDSADPIYWHQEQWTGCLFKGKSPIIYGFTSHTFGCKSIQFLENSDQSLYVRCDNRH